MSTCYVNHNLFSLCTRLMRSEEILFGENRQKKLQCNYINPCFIDSPMIHSLFGRPLAGHAGRLPFG